MIKIKANNEDVEIKDQWSELDPDEFVQVIGWTTKFFNEKNPNIIDFRLGLFSILSGYSRGKKRFQSDDQDQINSNLLILANMLKFPIRPYYPEPVQLDVFPTDIRERLLIEFPHEVDDPRFTKIMELIKYYPIPNLRIERNLLPEINSLKGPVFTIDENGLADTDMSAREYVDASQFYRYYSETRTPDYLDRLVDILYRPSRELYKPSNHLVLSDEVKEIHPDQKAAVFFIFQYIQDYIMQRSEYSMLFGNGELRNNKINLGMNSVIYNLSKAGYGNTVEIGDLSLNDFFNLMIKQMQDEVGSLRAAGWNDGKIARETKINIEIITRL